MRSAFLKAGIFVAAALLTACGGESSGPPTAPSPVAVAAPTPAPDPCSVPPVFWNGWSWSGPAPSGFVIGRLTVLTRGVIRATADWEGVANNVDMYLTEADCVSFPGRVGPPGCKRIYARADSRTAKPEVMQACVDPGVYGFMLVDRGPYASRGKFRLEAPQGTPQ
jgi:hypothetical protein